MAEGAETPHLQPHYLVRSEHPQIAVTWSTAAIPARGKPPVFDVLKLRKRVEAFPLEFTFKARSSAGVQ